MSENVNDEPTQPTTEDEQPETDPEFPPTEGEQQDTEHELIEGEQFIIEEEPPIGYHFEAEGFTVEEDQDENIESHDEDDDKGKDEIPSKFVWDGILKQEDIEYLALAKSITEQNRLCQELKSYIDDKKTKGFKTTCEDREISSLEARYMEQHGMLMAMMQEAIGLRSEEDQYWRKETSVEEDLEAARILRDLCATCKKPQGPCDLDRKKEDMKCKKCGAKTRNKNSKNQEIVKVVLRIEKLLDSLKNNLDNLKHR